LDLDLAVGLDSTPNSYGQIWAVRFSESSGSVFVTFEPGGSVWFLGWIGTASQILVFELK